MKVILILALVIALVGCDSEVGRTYYEDEIRFVTTTQSCSTGAGYCCTTGMTFSGKFKTGCGMYHSCPGSQPVIVKVIPFTTVHESGKIKQREARSVVQTLGVCQ